MSLEEDTINPIINFFHKLLGTNLWILPVSVAVSSWILYYIYPNIWWHLYIAMICSSIAFLHLCSISFVGIKKAIKRHKCKKAEERMAMKKSEQERVENERRKREHANTIWKYVAHLDKDLISATCCFLQLDIHDEDKHIRFVKIPNEDFSDKVKLYRLYFRIIEELTFKCGYNSSIKMIDYERVNDVMYFQIEPYFYTLLENYESTKKWNKL